MLSLLIGAIQAASFSGGSPAELARNVAEATHSPVLIEASPGDFFKVFSYPVSSVDEMSRAISKATGLRRAAGADNVFYRPRLPSWHFELGAVRSAFNDAAAASGAASPAITDGKVAFRCERGTGSLATALEGLAFSKPLSVDRFFAGLSLSGWVDGVPERDFLNLVAKTIGATLSVRKERLALEPNGAEVQKRALATLDEAKKADGYEKLSKVDKAELELSRSAIATAPAAALASMASDGTPIRIEIGPAIRPSVLAYLQALSEPAPEPPNRFGPPNPPTLPGRAGADPSTDRFRNIDRRLLGYATLARGFRVSLELATVGAYGRPGPLMRVP